jgi:hypothetical protein
MKTDGPWNAEKITAYLDETVIPLRLACHTKTGWPLVLSLWFTHEDGVLWCATRSNARVLRHLRHDPRCAFEVARDAPPYRGVRGQARCSFHPERGGEILRVLLQRYLGNLETRLARWLLSREADEVAIRIAPVRLSSWDFTERMVES